MVILRGDFPVEFYRFRVVRLDDGLEAVFLVIRSRAALSRIGVGLVFQSDAARTYKNLQKNLTLMVFKRLWLVWKVDRKILEIAKITLLISLWI